jgi:hypothetical protein
VEHVSRKRIGSPQSQEFSRCDERIRRECGQFHRVSMNLAVAGVDLRVPQLIRYSLPQYFEFCLKNFFGTTP